MPVTLTLNAKTLEHDIIFRHDAPKMFNLTINSYVKQHPKMNSKKAVKHIKADFYPLFIPNGCFLWKALIAYAKAKQLHLSKITQGFVYGGDYGKVFDGIFFLRPSLEDRKQVPLLRDILPDNYQDFVKWVNLHVGIKK